MSFEIRIADLGGPVAYADFGGSGPPVLLVHGLAGSHLNWTLAAPSLARGHRVLAIDLIGFGATPRAGRPASVDNHLGLVDRFVREVVGEPVTLAGHSMGGLVAILEAAEHPSGVKGVVLVSPALPGREGQALAGPERYLVPLLSLAPGLGAPLARRQVVASGIDRVVESSLRHVTTDTASLPADFVAVHTALERERSLADDGYRAYLESWRSLRRLLRTKTRVDRAILSIAQPVLLVHGGLDRLIPVESARRAHAMRPDWDYREMAGFGHSYQFEDPDGFTALVEGWLASAIR